jgi:hypothetical protein
MKLQISAKCSDMFSATLINDKGKVVGKYAGYVPGFFPDPIVRHFGDYVQLEIDIETGKIMNWKKPSKTVLKETFLKENS